MNRIVQKQIVCDNFYNAIIHNSAFNGSSGIGEGRIILNFVTAAFKINYFKCAGIRLVCRWVKKVIPPFQPGPAALDAAVDPGPVIMAGPADDEYAVDTFLDVYKMLLISTSDPRRFFCCDLNTELFIPEDNYECWAFITDYDDRGEAGALAYFENESGADSVPVLNSNIANVKNHHLPSLCYYPDDAVFAYKEWYIKALVEMENLPETRSTLRAINEIPVNG